MCREGHEIKTDCSEFFPDESNYGGSRFQASGLKSDRLMSERLRKEELGDLRRVSLDGVPHIIEEREIEKSQSGEEDSFDEIELKKKPELKKFEKKKLIAKFKRKNRMNSRSLDIRTKNMNKTELFLHNNKKMLEGWIPENQNKKFENRFLKVPGTWSNRKPRKKNSSNKSQKNFSLPKIKAFNDAKFKQSRKKGSAFHSHRQTNKAIRPSIKFRTKKGQPLSSNRRTSIFTNNNDIVIEEESQNEFSTIFEDLIKKIGPKHMNKKELMNLESPYKLYLDKFQVDPQMMSIADLDDRKLNDMNIEFEKKLDLAKKREKKKRELVKIFNNRKKKFAHVIV